MNATVCRRFLRLSLVSATLGLTVSAPAADAPAGRQWPRLLDVDDQSRIEPRPKDQLIAFTLYTVQNGVLKLSAQLFPLEENDPHTVTLETLDGGDWKRVAEAKVHPVGWTATFRVTRWNASRDAKYRVRHPLGACHEGVIRRDPADKPVIVAAAFTGNSPGPGGGKISKKDVVESVAKLKPDVLLFTGDQVYPHTTHTQHWLEWGVLFGELTRNIPTVTIPDDHDVGQPNLWGQSGRFAKVDTDGGYTRPVAYVQMVERQQTAHLPDPVDPRPVERGIGVYFTRLHVGGIDFAIIEDRKFKSGCADLDIVGRKLGPRPDHIESAGVDTKQLDVPGKELLGARQMKFLNQWAVNWDGAVMKSVVSQTAFGMTSTHHGAKKSFYWADLDANGWPQTARNQAIEAMRRGFAFHICGDQHLATMGQYGVQDFGDSGWWFCVPSVANLYPRWWQPKHAPVRRLDGPLDYCGDYLDGFGNKMTFYAHTNPRPSNREPAELHDRMPGFGIVRFNKPTRQITMECWPRMVDVTKPANQYTGWPRTIHQFDNYDRKPAAFLPTLEIEGTTDPVVQVVDQADGQIVYTVRIQGTSFRPKVFRHGKHTVRIWNGTHSATLRDLDPLPANAAKTMKVRLERP